MTITEHKNSCLGCKKNYNLDGPFLGHYFYIHILSLSDLCLGVEKKILKEIMQLISCARFKRRRSAYNKKSRVAKNMKTTRMISTKYI